MFLSLSLIERFFVCVWYFRRKWNSIEFFFSKFSNFYEETPLFSSSYFLKHLICLEIKKIYINLIRFGFYLNDRGLKLLWNIITGYDCERDFFPKSKINQFSVTNTQLLTKSRINYAIQISSTPDRCFFLRENSFVCPIFI